MKSLSDIVATILAVVAVYAFLFLMFHQQLINDWAERLFK